MLPSLDRLHIHTGEFYALSQSEVDKLNADGGEEPLTQEPFQKDVRRYGIGGWRKVVPYARPNQNTWRTFRVRSRDARPDGTYSYQYYHARSLWRHYNSDTEVRDPLTRQRLWYEDWMALHNAYDANGLVPQWVYGLPKIDPNTIVVRPSPEEENARRRERMAQTDDQGSSPPATPTPVPVTRQSGDTVLTAPPRVQRHNAMPMTAEDIAAREEHFRRWEERESARLHQDYETRQNNMIDARNAWIRRLLDFTNPTRTPEELARLHREATAAEIRMQQMLDHRFMILDRSYQREPGREDAETEANNLRQSTDLARAFRMNMIINFQPREEMARRDELMLTTQNYTEKVRWMRDVQAMRDLQVELPGRRRRPPTAE